MKAPSCSLQVTDLKKHFGGVRALDGVGFTIKSGQCVALIGPNGAGKSTCFAVLAGQLKPDAGRVLWSQGTPETAQTLQPAQAAQDITGLPATALHARGIGRTFQVAQVFEALTVLQNVQLVMQHSYLFSGVLPLNQQGQGAAMALLESLGLQSVAHTPALGLAYGLKKRLELGIALAGKPRLLLLDEPAAGLAQTERRDLMRLVKSLTTPEHNLAVLYTEHNMDAVFGVADRVLVLIDGQLAAQGTPEEIAANDTVRSRYLGNNQLHTGTSAVQRGAASGAGAAHA